MTAPLANETWRADARPATRRDVLVLHSRSRLDRRAIWAATVIAAAGLLLAGLVYLSGVSSRGGGGRVRSPGAVTRTALPAPVRQSAVIYDTAVMPLAPEEASAINAKRPLDIARPVPARALMVAKESAGGVGYAAALRCLTQAVYYEAASEPDAGQRGVAQVVLNRVRHPAFPNTVCGVVYQGSERVTGCQFSFTCDGSLARIPSVAGWARAERVARDALGGKVAAAVGNATHYHADYVVPYWAPTLDKAATIGAHIFYLMRGSLGSPRAFSTRYDVALEAPPAAGLLGTDTPTDEGSGLLDFAGSPATLGAPAAMLAADARSGRLIAGPAATKFDWSEPANLRADELPGTLKAPAFGVLKADDGAEEDRADGPSATPSTD